MAVSQNGYTYGDISKTSIYTVTAAGRTMRFWTGSPGEMLADFVRWFDENIRSIDEGILDDWSWAVRPIRGSEEGSNHGSGTAADVDATKWPLGVDPSRYLTPSEIARIRVKLREYEGCIRWGGDYTGRKDPMHFEINRDQRTCDLVWARIKAARAGKPVPPAGAPAVFATQRALNFVPALGEVDGFWGEQTERGVNTVRNAINGKFPYGVKEAQTRVGALSDGDWGVQSRLALTQTIRELQAAWGAGVDGQWGPNTEARWKANRAAYYRP